MSCARPKPAWKVGEGIDFRRPHGAGGPDYMIPCGKCVCCSSSKALEWAIRICHEAQCHDQVSFVTLTYDEEHCPESINKLDVQLFLKRLRAESDREIRYFIAGEYGELSRRPHYHAIIFGNDFLGGRYTYRIDERLHGNKVLDHIWRNGSCAVAQFSTATAMYTAGYCNKKIGDKDTFSMQSRFPPLGKRWLERHLREVTQLEKTVIDGTEYPIPPQYYDWALAEGWIDDAGYSRIKANRQAKNKQRWPQEMLAQEANRRARVGESFQREVI